jgi:purine-binding chemotaxis protein CheW
MEITAVPQTPDYVKGVINLRGQVIPVVDLRLKFQMQEQEVTDQTCIIVVEIDNGKHKFNTGIMVCETKSWHAQPVLRSAFQYACQSLL